MLKMLLQKLNDVATAAAEKHGETAIAGALDFLIEYTDFHFNAEEASMQESGFPELPGHRERHAEFRRTLADLVRDFREEGATHSLADAVHTLLGNWLVRHIRGVDGRYGEFLRERG